MTEIQFTAGITFQDNRVITVDVTTIDGDGIGYVADEGPRQVRWDEVKAVMLATTDHMLESGAYLLDMAQLVEARQEVQPYDPEALRRLGIGILRQAAPLLCPRRGACELRPGFRSNPPSSPPPTPTP